MAKQRIWKAPTKVCCFVCVPILFVVYHSFDRAMRTAGVIFARHRGGRGEWGPRISVVGNSRRFNLRDIQYGRETKETIERDIF